MKDRLRAGAILAGLIGIVAASLLPAQTPMGTVVTYQGRLADGGTPASGTFDFQFVLFTASVGGSQVGPVLTANDVVVTQGLFTVPLDFGAVFDGSKRWLEIGVRTGSSGGAYAILSPRQELTAGPGSLFSSTTPWSGISGKPAGFADDVDNDTIYTGGAGISVSGTVISVATNGITSAMIADNTITTAEILDSTITSADIANGNITGADILDNSLFSADLADNSVTSADIADNTISTFDILDNSVTGLDIADESLLATDIATNAVASLEIADNSITAADIAANAVTTNEILNGTILQADIAAPNPPNIVNVTGDVDCLGKEFIPLVLCVVGDEPDVPDCDVVGIGDICEHDSGCDSLNPSLDNCGTTDMYMRIQ